MSTNLVSTNNLAVNNNLTVNGNILGSGTIQTTSNIQGANITTSGNINATNVNITGQLNSLTLNNLNSLDTTTSIQSQLNNLTGNVTALQTKTSPITYNSSNLGIFNTSPSYPLDVTASTFRIGPLVQENNNGTICLTNTSCSSDPANFCLYQGVNGDTVLNCGLNETIEFKVHNSQVAMLNSTGIGVGNGNPQHPIDVTGVISASSDVLINGNSVSNSLSGLTNDFTNLLKIKACGYWDGNNSMSTPVINMVSSASYGNWTLQGTGQTLNGVLITLGTIVNPTLNYMFATPTDAGYVCKCTLYATGTHFEFVVNSQGGGTFPQNGNNPFYWFVI